jgi:hypothetical protein
MHGDERVLHDFFRYGQVRYQQCREPDQQSIVRRVKRGHRVLSVLVGPGSRNLAADVLLVTGLGWRAVP